MRGVLRRNRVSRGTTIPMSGLLKKGAVKSA
jgi:hypothetical protein